MTIKEASLSQSDNTEYKKIFKTYKNEKIEEEQNDMKKMMRLMKNRVSARKCRQKKKSYVQTLEKEVEDLQKELINLKSINSKEQQTERLINLVFIYIIFSLIIKKRKLIII